MTRQYFGTDGIRGEVGKFPIVPDFVMRLGYAAGQVLAKNARSQRLAQARREGTALKGVHQGRGTGAREQAKNMRHGPEYATLP